MRPREVLQKPRQAGQPFDVAGRAQQLPFAPDLVNRAKQKRSKAHALLTVSKSNYVLQWHFVDRIGCFIYGIVCRVTGDGNNRDHSTAEAQWDGNHFGENASPLHQAEGKQSGYSDFSGKVVHGNLQRTFCKSL